MDNTLKRTELLQAVLAANNRSAQLCKNHCVENELSDNLHQLQKNVLKYSELDLQMKHFNKTLEATENYFKNVENTKDVTVEEKFNEFNRKNLTLDNTTLSTHPFMIQFLKNIDEAEYEQEFDVNDEEFVVPTDPVTKQLIRNPVKNPQCGHIYESESITELVSIRKNTRCPYIGCPALQYIQIAQLVVDKDLKRKIDNYNLKH